MSGEQYRPEPAWLLHPAIGAVASVGVLSALTAIMAPLLGHDGLTNAALVLLLAVLLAAAVWGYRVGLLSAVVADLSLNFFFTSPLHTFNVANASHLGALVVFLAVALIGATLLGRLRRQAALATARRSELRAMLDLSRRLALAPNPELALEALAESIRRPVAARRCDILEKVGGAWRIAVSTSRSPEMTREDAGFAEHAVSTGQLIRSLPEGQRRHPFRRAAQAAASVSYIPFRTPEGGAGAIRLEGELRAPGAGDLEALLRAFADETGVAVHRAGLARQARAAEDIRRSDELKSALLASVSHDLRSPLTAIKAAVGSLRTPGLAWTEEDREQLLSLIESQTDRLTATVTDLLDMSRIEGGAVQPDIEPVQVAPLLEEAAVPARTAGRPVEIDAPADLWLRADYGLLLQALRNLVENAVKYASGAIRLRGREDGRLAFLEVSDEGPGIDPADLPHVFERFYRGTRTREKPQGTGLGLSIVRAMVELCGGRVSVASSPAGTTFQVTLPAVEPPR